MIKRLNWLPCIGYALLPLLVLLIAATFACIVSFALIQFWPTLSLRTLVSKITLVLLILSIFPGMALAKLNRQQLGFAERRQFLRQLLRGFALGLLSLLPVVFLLYQLDVSIIDVGQHFFSDLL